MKKALLLYLLLAVSIQAAPATPAAEKVLEKNIQARGGLKAYQQIKTRKKVEIVTVEGTQIRAETLDFVPDGKFHQIVEHPTMGRTEVGYDGLRVWQRSLAMQGVMPSDDSRTRAIRRGVRISEFWDYKKDERKFDYAGVHKFEGADYDVLLSTVTNPVGREAPARYYFDRAGLLRFIIAGEDSSMRQEFSDFRAIDGIQYAFKTKSSSPGVVIEVQVQEIRHNVPLNFAVFTYQEQAAEKTEKDKP